MLLVENIESPAPVKNKNCICRNPKEKNEIDQIPPDDSAKLELCKRCCFNGKCTINQLLKICQEDPDIIMDVFKMATADEKCLPEVELTYDQPQNKDDNSDKNVDPQNKYHFLMVDNSTSLYVVQQQVPDNFRAAEQGDKKEDIAEIKEECNHETEDQERSQEIIEALLQNKENLSKGILKTSQSKYQKDISIKTKTASMEKLIDRIRNLLWTDSDDQIMPEINVRKSRKKSIRKNYEQLVSPDTEKSTSEDEQEKGKNIYWTPSYFEDEDTILIPRVQQNWQTSPDNSELSSLMNTPSTYLESLIKKHKNRHSSRRHGTITTVIGKNVEARDKVSRKHWSRCFACFKCKKKTKPDTKLSNVLEIANETEDTASYNSEE
ncbi:uncharacterized protein isoform X1 [Leptinotarsa decemlineata]|uniref:uncharacterized protein isoform X1 n=1 Tax=Leptinotarsa decemlineata TaxID=7539 RepID=UPI000C25332A|nr:uncharacterized protein LOC111516773 isoform X1 [Leptinotarsa decemlineata]